MARKAHILYQVLDCWGDPHDVREERPTPHGWPVLLGWPAGRRGKGYGGPRVIVTKDLAAYADSRRAPVLRPWDLPIGGTAAKRVRRLLGLHRRLDAAAWWEERIDDLAALTIEEFAAKHARKASAVERARLALLGKSLREPGWYRLEPARSLLVGHAGRTHVADELGISVGAVGRLRYVLRKESLHGRD